MKKENIYFASDFHLGSPNWKESSIREKIIVEWLDQIKKDAKEIYLLGDIFDFWYEYKKVVPKGFIRFLGKLAELSDNNIQIHIIVGNHDLWMRDYLNKEIGISIHQNSIIINRYNKSIFLAHGDNVGKQKISYKLIKSIFLKIKSIFLKIKSIFLKIKSIFLKIKSILKCFLLGKGEGVPSF